MRYAPVMPHHLPSVSLAAMPAGHRGIKDAEGLQLLLLESSKLFLVLILKAADCLICAGTTLYFSTSSLCVGESEMKN